MNKTYSPEIKSEVCEKLRLGMSLSEVSAHYGIPISTISGWLKRTSIGKTGEELEIGRLKRENEALYSLLGRMSAEHSFLKKKK
jgi:transposase